MGQRALVGSVPAGSVPAETVPGSTLSSIPFPNICWHRLIIMWKRSQIGSKGSIIRSKKTIRQLGHLCVFGTGSVNLLVFGAHSTSFPLRLSSTRLPDYLTLILVLCVKLERRHNPQGEIWPSAVFLYREAQSTQLHMTLLWELPLNISKRLPLLQNIMGCIINHSNFKADQFSYENMSQFKHTHRWNKCQEIPNSAGKVFPST